MQYYRHGNNLSCSECDKRRRSYGLKVWTNGALLKTETEHQRLRVSCVFGLFWLPKMHLVQFALPLFALLTLDLLGQELG